MPSVKWTSNVLLQSYQPVFGRLSVYIITGLKVFIHVYFKRNLHWVSYLLTEVWEALDVEYLNLWLETNLSELFSLGRLATLLAFVLVILVELGHCEAVAQARFQIRSMWEGPTLKGLISDWVMVTIDALDGWPFKSCEKAVDATRVQFEIFFVNLSEWPGCPVSRDVSVEFLCVHWGFLSLKLIKQVHQEHVSIMLVKRVKILTEHSFVSVWKR